ncbi:MAG: helix-turn-helix domain-containing protein [Polyangiales bacterium]
MDPLHAASEALSRGDPLRALGHVALRDDAPALALRATALAQLGEYEDAKRLLNRAERGFRREHAVARARCVVALAELALATRELLRADAGLARAIAVLERSGDRDNARYARMLHARHGLAVGDVRRAEERLAAIDRNRAAPVLAALIALTQAEIALRRMQPEPAHAALIVAEREAMRAQVPALIAEVEASRAALARPVARVVRADGTGLLTLDDVCALRAGPALVVDACRRVVQQGDACVQLDTKPVLFGLLRQLAEAAPQPVGRDALIRVGFGMRRSSDALRARLRVAMGRLRKLLGPLAVVRATEHGFALVPRAPRAVVLLPPQDDDASALLALLSDGEAWSTSALALALGASQRTVQRALRALETRDRARSLGRGKNRRWLAPPMHAFATHMLLPPPSPGA